MHASIIRAVALFALLALTSCGPLTLAMTPAATPTPVPTVVPTPLPTPVPPKWSEHLDGRWSEASGRTSYLIDVEGGHFTGFMGTTTMAIPMQVSHEEGKLITLVFNHGTQTEPARFLDQDTLLLEGMTLIRQH